MTWVPVVSAAVAVVASEEGGPDPVITALLAFVLGVALGAALVGFMHTR